MNESRLPPTVYDLRVKTCYICREEERFDSPEDPPRAWTHPCNCTLVAHEACLLQWIQTSQQNASRAPNALKCPQCGAKYELESDNPTILKVLDAGNKSLSMIGRLVTVASISVVVASFGTGIYIISTAYGAYAMQQFIGKERVPMYDLLLTDDPSNWPWHAFLNLPLVPLSLILSRTPVTSHILPIVPILLAWPTSSPVASREHILLNHWARPENASRIELTQLPSVSGWPPSPVLFGLFIFPVARLCYRRLFTKLTNWVLDSTPSQVTPVRRFIWALNDHGPFGIRIGADARPVRAPVQEPVRLNEGDRVDQDANVAPEGDAVAAAEQTIRVSGASLGRLIGGALVLPALSNIMGNLLFCLSKRSVLLRHVLGVRPALDGRLPPPPFGPYSLDRNWGDMGRMKQIGVALRIVLGSVWGGTRTWTACDPVWWRNSIGLGLFVVAKDCLHLLHLWLTKRELETRRVKNRSFEGVDYRELDLINPRSLRRLSLP